MLAGAYIDVVCAECGMRRWRLTVPALVVLEALWEAVVLTAVVAAAEATPDEVAADADEAEAVA